MHIRGKLASLCGEQCLHVELYSVVENVRDIFENRPHITLTLGRSQICTPFNQLKNPSKKAT